VSSKVSENSLPSIKKIDENGNQHMQVLNDLSGPPNFSRRSLLGRIVTAGSASFLLTSWPLEHSIALTPDQAESSYDKYASTYDDLDGGAVASALGLDDARRALVGSRLVHGNVLEIGVGTGLNMDKYNLSNGNISSICFLDISEGMIQVAMQKLPSVFPPRDERNFDIDFVRADATSQLLDIFGSNSLDTVIDTFSLCVLGNSGALQCLQQMRQVVKPRSEGGRILLLENTRADNPLLGKYQDITADLAASLGGRGCVYNQNVEKLILQAGLKIEYQQPYSGGLFRSFVCYRE